jgi:excisionase family DNA binding protein
MKSIENDPSSITKLLYSIEEAQECLGGLGRTTLFSLIRRGEIRIIKVGRRTLIPFDQLESFVITNSAFPGVTLGANN